MAVEVNKAIALRYWEAWKTGNLAIVDAIFATDYVFHNAAGSTRSRAPQTWDHELAHRVS